MKLSGTSAAATAILQLSSSVLEGQALFRSKKEYASGAAKLGPCLTDAARESRSRRAVRIFPAMLTPERLRQCAAQTRNIFAAVEIDNRQKVGNDIAVAVTH